MMTPSASTIPESQSQPTPELEAAFGVLARCVAEGLVPGAAAAAGTASGTLYQARFGLAAVVPEPRPLPERPLFDLASLTKIVATTTLALRYLEQGRLHLGQRVATVLPAFGAAGKHDVTFQHLLTHTSGLPSWRRLYGPGLSPQAALETIYRLPLERPPGTAVVYSDLGFMVLGAALAEIGGAPLDVLARREVFEPLGLRDTCFCPGPQLRERCVATEVVAERGGLIWGTVHDENADAQGGVSGHAGLFSTVHDLARFCLLWLGKGTIDGLRFLSPATVAAATRDQTHLDQRRGLGWVLQPNAYWVPADLCSPAAYSHTGFTGTSLLIDPEYDLFAVLLTNRVHPTRGDQSAERIRTVRARFHNAVWAALAR